MKPLNFDDPGCNYTTSNCVVWQGPDLPCINLCKGATVSDVVYQMATELCAVLDILKIEAYDLSCFNLTACKPKDFQELMQFILDRLCCVEKCSGCIPSCDGKCPTLDSPALPGGAGCPDCVVPIAKCLYFNNNLGDQVTELQLTDYVTLLGNKLCDLFTALNIDSETLTDLTVRVTELENAPPPAYVPPTVTPQCVLPPVPTEMDVVLAALETQFCQLRGATGLPDEIYTAIATQCAGLNGEPTLNGTGATMATLPGWSSMVNNMAQAFSNMWLTVCDMRAAIKTIQVNCCPAGCDGISLSLLGILEGDILTVYISGTIPAGFVMCNPAGTPLSIKDSAGNSILVNLDIITILNVPTGYAINLAATPINTSLDLSLEMTTCLTNAATGATCESCLDYFLNNESTCPVLALSATDTTVGFEFNSNVGAFTYTVELANSVGTILSTQTFVTEVAEPIIGVFEDLTPTTTYKVRISIRPTICPLCTPTVCPFVVVETLVLDCPAPESVEATVTIVT